MHALIATMGIGLLFAGAAQACSEADQAALEKFDRDWGAAATAGDRARLETFLAPGFVDLAPGALVDRKTSLDATVADAAEAKAAAEQAGGTAEPEPNHDFYLINCTDRSALITHRNWGERGEAAGGGIWMTRSVHQLEKIDGRWKVVSNATHDLGDEQYLGYLDLEWNLAELAGDKAWFERNLAHDYTGVSSRNGSLEDKRHFLADLGRDKVTLADTSDMDVNVDGDRAQVTGVYHTRGTDKDGKAFERRTRYIDTFVRRDGRWQIWSSQGTEIRD
jgi:hypothetical protein